MTWRVHLVEITTGQVGRALDPVSLSWAIELNKADSGSVKVQKADLATVGREWLSPWWAGVLVSYVDAAGLVTPWCGGPVRTWAAETADTLDLQFGGMRDMFTRRHLERDYALAGMSLGSIAWELVRAGMDRLGGGLPVVHGSPYERLSPGHQRTYEAWNLGNNNVEKRLTEITNVIGGPDMMFRPEWADREQTRARWRFVHGTSWDPMIEQKGRLVWDSTAAASQLTDLSIKSDASRVATRVFGTGAGEGAATVRTQAASNALIAQGFPALEDVISDQDQTKAEPIRQKCMGRLADSRRMVDQLSASIQIDDARAPLGSWHVGDRVTVKLGDQWWAIPGGDHDMDIIRASGGLGDTVDLELQEGHWSASGDLL